MEPLSIDQLARESTLVAHGMVVSKSCRRDAQGRVFTRVELVVSEVWKGTPTNRVTIVHGGGILGDRKATVSGQVDYGVGEEVVAFLVFNPRGQAVTVGLAQGKFGVRRDPGGIEAQVHNPFHGAPAIPGRVPGESTGPPERRPLALAELKRRVIGS